MIKQCRERLRVAMEWHARLDRIWTESRHARSPPRDPARGNGPEVLFEDRPNYLFAMTCAPDDAVTWKTHLMAGQIDPTIAARLGTILGTIHAEAHGTLPSAELWPTPACSTSCGSTPTTGRSRGAIRTWPRASRRLIAAMDRPEDERTLVLGDFSPKNILVHSGGLILLDFECAHAGDPAFDLGFFLTHLLLKTIRAVSNDPTARRREYLGLTRAVLDSPISIGETSTRAARPSWCVEPACTRRPAAWRGSTARARSSTWTPAAKPSHGRSPARRFEAEPATWDDLCKILEDAIGRRNGMATLKGLKARQVLDSRGRPTVEVDAIASTGAVGRAIVPSGPARAGTRRSSCATARARVTADWASSRPSTTSPGRSPRRSLGIDLDDQSGLDARLIALDGTPNKGRLGANAVLGVSLAVAHAAAAARGEELFVHLNRLWREATRSGGRTSARLEPALPLPMVNMISGGLHAGGNLDIQDVLIVPVGASSYSEALEMTVALYRAVGAVLKERGFESALVGDEGGYGPRLREQRAGVRNRRGRDASPAASSPGATWRSPSTWPRPISSTRLAETYRLRATGDPELDSRGHDRPPGRLGRALSRSSRIEDGLAEDDWDGWTALTDATGRSVQLIGDDLFATQVARLQQGIDRRAGNAVLIKLNQVGTLTETFDALRLARSHGFRTVVSARSGETEDTTIADLAVATAAGQIKIGSVARSERLAKYNRLLRIEEALGPRRDAPVSRGRFAP